MSGDGIEITEGITLPAGGGLWPDILGFDVLVRCPEILTKIIQRRVGTPSPDHTASLESSCFLRDSFR